MYILNCIGFINSNKDHFELLYLTFVLDHAVVHWVSWIWSHLNKFCPSRTSKIAKNKFIILPLKHVGYHQNRGSYSHLGQHFI